MRASPLHLLKNPIFLHKTPFPRIYATACLQYLPDDDQLIDSHPLTGNLHPLPARVFHTLSWRLTRQVRFSDAVARYGLPHSLHIFTTIAHIFSSAGRDREVHAVFMDIVSSGHQHIEYNCNAFELFGELLGLSPGAERPGAVFEVLMKVYARSKMVDNAVHIFELAKGVGIEVDVKSCNFVLKCLAEGNRGELVTSLFDRMRRSGPRPNEYTYTILMQFYCQDQENPCSPCSRIDRASEILDEMEKCGVNPTNVTYGVYVNALCKSGTAVGALRVLDCLRRRDRILSTNSYNAVICGFCCRGEVNKAREAIREMRSWGVPLDVHSYSRLIADLCKNGDVTEALELLLEMKSDGIKPFIVTINSVLHCLCKSGSKLDEAFTIMEEMQSLGVSLNEHSYNILIDGICKCEKGGIEDSRLVQTYMISDGIEPSIVTISPRLNSLCKSGKMDDALREFQTIEKHDVISYGIMIDGYCKHGNVDAAKELMEKMIADKLTPDVRIYNSFLRAMSLQKAWESFHAMLDRGTLPNTYTCTIMVDKFCKEGSLEKALVFMYKLQDKGIYPNLHTYNAVISRLCKEGKTKDTKKILCAMLKRKLYPDVVIYSTIIDGFAKELNLAEALNWYKKMLQDHIVPNVITYTSLVGILLSCTREIEATALFKQIVSDKASYPAIIAGFCKTGDMEKALEYYHRMIGGGLVPDIVTITTIVHGFSQIGDMNKSLVFLDEMEKFGITPNVVTCTVIEAGFCRLGLPNKAYEVYNVMRNRGDVG